MNKHPAEKGDDKHPLTRGVIIGLLEQGSKHSHNAEHRCHEHCRRVQQRLPFKALDHERASSCQTQIEDVQPQGRSELRAGGGYAGLFVD